MRLHLSPICVAASLYGCAFAHGHIKSLVLNSATYTAFLPVPTPDFTAAPPSIVRRIGGDGPVLNISSNDITCNFNATPIADNGVSRVGNVTAGSDMVFHWTSWPHSGPILTYMARCDPDCGSFTGSTGKVWFKVDERGYNVTSAEWATGYLYANDNTWITKVPACLPAGEYLVRHEIIALSDCKTVGKCQFYPECTQVRVLGGGSATVPADQLVGFPGGYATNDPGILWDTNTANPADYQIPGPKLFTCP